MPTAADLIEDVVVTRLREVAGLEDALDHEPQGLPRALPVTTLLFLGGNPVQAETGGGEDVTYRWRLSLYTSLQDFKRAQQQLKDLLPLIFGKIRAHPTADGLCDFLQIADEGDEPVFAIGTTAGGWLRKSVILTATLTEYPTPMPPAGLSAPTITGSPIVGQTLTATPGEWSGTTPMTFEYQWYLYNGGNGTPIPGATGSTLLLDASELGDSVLVNVTATNVAGSAGANSSITDVVTA